MGTVKLVTRTRGKNQDVDIQTAGGGITAIVSPVDIKVSIPSAKGISSEDTLKCMSDMSQKAWVHISTGELFQYFYFKLFGDGAWLPETIADLNEESLGVIHGCGLIILLVEARFDSIPLVHVQSPECHLHPQQQVNLMEVFLGIGKIPIGGGAPDMEVKA